MVQAGPGTINDKIGLTLAHCKVVQTSGHQAIAARGNVSRSPWLESIARANIEDYRLKPVDSGPTESRAAAEAASKRGRLPRRLKARSAL